VQTSFAPVLLLLICSAGLALVLLLMANVFNPGRPGRVKQMPYESGMDPVHDTRRRFTVRFHLVAIAFLVFDVELLFLYPWAVAARHTPPQEGAIPRGIDAAVATPGWIESRDLVFGGVMVLFALLALGFLYDWRKGVFRWR